MGWVHDVPEDDLYDHEGYAVAVLGDGSEPAASSWWNYDGSEGRPRAIAVRAGCECGWRSKEMFPIDFADHEATEGFEFNDGPFGAWSTEHIGQLLGTTVPLELTEAIATVRRMLAGLASSRPLAAITAAADVEKLAGARLQDAVTVARGRDASWESIGKAAGTTRQSAHQRWSKVLLPKL